MWRNQRIPKHTPCLSGTSGAQYKYKQIILSKDVQNVKLNAAANLFS